MPPSEQSAGEQVQEESDPLVGRTIAGKIAIEALVGRGAMGSVYRGRHLALDEAVAVKVMHRGFATDPEFAARFRREATAMVRLKHPNSVRVLDFGEEPDGLLYLVMEFLDGRDLGRLMQLDSPLTPTRIAHLLRQTLSALQAAHDADIIHRDIKPENIFVVAGTDDDGVAIEVAKVCDFGIAKIRDPGSTSGARPRSPHVTTEGLVIGTPAYMSPEQARGGNVDARSDLYSIGVILYELLTGRVPFEADSAIDVILRHVTESPAAPSTLTADVHPLLEEICLKALQKVPDERFATAREMRVALRAVDENGPQTIRPPATSTMPPHGGTETSLQVDLARVSEEVRGTRDSKPTVRSDDRSARRRAPRRWALTGGALVVTLLAAFALLRTRSSVPSRAAPELAPSSSATTPPATAAGSSTSELAELTPGPAPSASSFAPSVVVARGSGSAVPSPRPKAPAVASAAPLDPPAAPSTPASVSPASTPEPSPPSATVVAMPAPPPPPSFDISTASVALAGVGATEGVLKSVVSSSLGRATGAMTACYRTELRSATSPEMGRGSLHVDTDDSGMVNGARATVAFSATVARCIERAVLGVRFTGVDTGSASADVSLSFEVH